MGKSFEWKTRSHARSNWSVGVGKALFHISEFWLTGDVVPTVIAELKLKGLPKELSVGTPEIVKNGCFLLKNELIL